MYNITKKEKVVEFNNFLEVIDFIQEGKAAADGVGKFLHQQDHYSNNGFGYSIESTLDLISHGWPEGDKAIDIIFQTVQNRIKAEVDNGYTVQFDVSGSWLDIGRHVAGEPECFGELAIDHKDKPAIKIILNSTVSAGIPVDYIRNRGAALLAFIDYLRRDYEVSLEVINLVSCRGDAWGEMEGWNCLLKFKVDCSVDYSRDMVAFWTASERVTRSLVFSIQEIMSGQNDLMGYGSIIEYTPADNEFVFGALKLGAADINNFKTVESSIAYIQQAIKEFNERREV